MSQQDRNSDVTNWHDSLDGGNLNLILPDEELLVIIDYTERENQSSPGMSPLIGYPMLKIYTYTYTRSTLGAASEPTLKDYKDPFALRQWPLLPFQQCAPELREVLY